jgi:uncharacterized protein (DUF2062 family)
MKKHRLIGGAVAMVVVVIHLLLMWASDVEFGAAAWVVNPAVSVIVWLTIFNVGHWLLHERGQGIEA